jgi:NADH-ubiquinone oxidoreductase chain 1
LGSLRSTAQLISYELILSSVILIVVLLTSSLNLTINVESQKTIYFLFPLFPLFIIFFIGCIAETNRAPFDLAEAESELVSGFMTEHSAGIFVFFFLAEYASIVLICIFAVILFIGGFLVTVISEFPIFLGLFSSLSLGFKTCFMIFVFIWVRASFPRIRFDQLMSVC